MKTVAGNLGIALSFGLLCCIGQASSREVLAKFLPYRDKSALVIRTSPPITQEIIKLPCIIHFHGYRFRNVDRDFAEMMRTFHFDENIADSKSEVLFVAPEGSFGRKSDYDLHHRYGTLAQIRSLMVWAQEQTHTRCSQLILSGHSAAYQVIERLLKSAGDVFTPDFVREIWLFDALYVDLSSEIAIWLEQSKLRRVRNVYLGDGVKRNSEKLPKTSRITNQLSTVKDHWRLLDGAYFLEFLKKN